MKHVSLVYDLAATQLELMVDGWDGTDVQLKQNEKFIQLNELIDELVKEHGVAEFTTIVYLEGRELYKQR